LTTIIAAKGTILTSEGLFRMDDPTQYREFADQCERFAADAKTEQHRKFLMEMAEAWRTLADKTKETN
jgi:hypothetical protein